MTTPEQLARQQIDALLAAAGWSVQDYSAYQPNAARGVALREVPLASGRCDYLLLVDRQPLGVIEAKRSGTRLVGVAEQSAHYAVNLPAFFQLQANELPFAYESTGTETFFRDARDPAPRSRPVFAFHQPATLAAWAAEPDTLRARLQHLPALIETNMRACQVEAVTHLDASFAQDKPPGHRADAAARRFVHFAMNCSVVAGASGASGCAKGLQMPSTAEEDLAEIHSACSRATSGERLGWAGLAFIGQF